MSSPMVEVFLVTWVVFPYKFLLFGLYVLAQIACSLRDPFFSYIFNTSFYSYNRATSLSLANFMRNVFDIPIMPLMAWGVGKNIIFPYIIVLAFGMITILFFRIDEKKFNQVYAAKTI